MERMRRLEMWRVRRGIIGGKGCLFRDYAPSVGGKRGQVSLVFYSIVFF